jgi:glutamine amidotransferase
MIAIIQYNAGNSTSVRYALERLGQSCLVTDNADLIRSADKVIFPGVGEASSAMQYLRNKGLDELLCSLTQPVLGICLGLQLLCQHSEEGNTTCLGVFDAEVRKFPPRDLVPHMGWNNLDIQPSPLLEGLRAEDDFYFVHSYYAEPCQQTRALCHYIEPFSAVLQCRNFYAVQFHPEKSADAGERVLTNFLKL